MPLKFFITHSWKDIQLARRLSEDLRANGLDGFLDAHSIDPGDSIPSRIERGLTECDVYIPVFSPDALKSDWCDWEIDMAITMNRTRQGRPRIIPVIARPCKVPDRLIHLLYIDFVGRYDDALYELLTKGLGLEHAPPAPLAPPERPVASPPVPSKNWLFPLAAVILLALVVLIATRAMFSASPAAPTPPSVAGLTLAAPSAVPSLTSVAVASTATPAPAAPTLPPPSTNIPLPVPTPGFGPTKTLADGSVMLFIPAGEFLMGSSNADKDAAEEEKPQHTVYLDAFRIGKYEVTNALYKKCVDAGKCAVPKDWANGALPADKENHPVVGVQWNDAAGYAQWVGARLPTEAEWEKAACWDEAKKTKRIYPWGDVFDDRKANTSGYGLADTIPVGTLSPQGDSPYGVSDMAGNVEEWVADRYNARYYVNSPKDNPKGAGSGIYRVSRGGGWDSYRFLVRCSSRGSNAPNLQYKSLGFRIAESVP